jgi:hypothetical protein
MATNTAPRIQQLVDEASFPMTKDALLTTADAAGVSPDDMELLNRLPDQTYMTDVDVALAISEVEIDRAQMPPAPRPPAKRSSSGPKRRTAKSQSSKGTPDVRSEASEATNRLATRVSGIAKERIETGKEGATKQLTRAAKFLREDEQGLRSSGATTLAEVTGVVATGLEQASGLLRDQDVERLAGSAQSAVRRRPLVAVGGAAAVGFLAVRFLKSGMGGTPPDEQENKNDR